MASIRGNSAEPATARRYLVEQPGLRHRSRNDSNIVISNRPALLD